MAQTIKLKRSSTEGAEPSTSDLALGEVAINTFDGKMFIKKNDGSDSIVELGTGGGGEATYTKTTVTATAGQTTVSSLTYTAGLVDVYLNGARLVVGQDVTATNGTSVVLASGANLNDIIQVVAFKTSDAFTPASPTFTGTVTAPIVNASTSLKIAGVAVTSTASELNLLDGVSTTPAELNLLDGATVTTAELNLLDGVTATTAELNLTAGLTATTAELNKLDGATCSTVELNTLTGLTSTAAELNLLDGVTATTLELNKLDGVTATTAELNYVDGVTSNIQTQIDAVVPGVHTISFTANGAIAANKPVILQTDGKVAEVAIADRTKTTTFDRATLNFLDPPGYDNYGENIVWDSGNTGIFVMCGKGRGTVTYPSNDGAPRVGTVTGLGADATITMGLETTNLNTSQEYRTMGVIALDAGRFMFHFEKSSENTYVIGQIVGTGTSAKLMLGKSEYTSGNAGDVDSTQQNQRTGHSMAYDPAVNKVVAVWGAGTGDRLRAQCISIDGLGLSLETPIAVDNEYNTTSQNRAPVIAADPNTSGLYVVAWRGVAAISYSGAFRQLKLTGTTLTTPASIKYLPDSAGYFSASSKHEGFSIVFDPTTARQFIVLESGLDGVRSWTAQVPSASGAFSSYITFTDTTNSNGTQVTTDLCGTVGLASIGQTASGEDGKYIVMYTPYTGSDTGKVYQQIGSLDGTTMTWGTRTQIDDHIMVMANTVTSQMVISADPIVAGRVIGLIYEKVADGGSWDGRFHIHLTEVGGVYNTTNLAGNFMGVAESAIADTASGNVAIKGGVATLSSLTPDSTYYVQGSGAINTTASTGTNIGKAVTTTKLLLKGL